MLKFLVFLLVLLNAVALAWQLNAFAPWSWGPQQHQEPERLKQQLRPEAIQPVPVAVPAPDPVTEPEPAAAQDTPNSNSPATKPAPATVTNTPAPWPTAPRWAPPREPAS